MNHELIYEIYLPTSLVENLDSARLHRLGPREEAAVDGINDRLCGNDPSAEKSTVKSLDSVLAALNPIEFEVDVALGIRIYSNVNNVTVFIFAFSADVVF